MKPVSTLTPLLLMAMIVAMAKDVCSEPAEQISSLGTIVWVAQPKEADAIKSSMAIVGEAGFEVIVEKADSPPSASEAVEILLAYRALVVIWHARSGSLNLLFHGESDLELVSAEPGSPNEEALFMRELLTARFGSDENALTDLLLTVPGEYINAHPDPPKKPDEANETTVPGPPSRLGWRLGAGYNIRLHSDEVTWAQQSIEFLLPTWRLSDLWIGRAIISLGLPSIIGEHGKEWLEIRTIETIFSLGLIPLRSENVGGEIGLGGGFINTSATAFLATGETRSAAHMSSQTRLWFALLWHLSNELNIRFYTDIAIVFGAPEFSINNKGNFGSFPLQWGCGLDIEVAIFDQ